MEWIELFVGGERFETLRSTLEQLAYFRARSNWSGPIKLDRDPVAFRALLNHLRDPRYEFPQQFWPELDFFDPIEPQRQPVEWDDKVEDLRHLPENVDGGHILPILVNSGSALPNTALMADSDRWPCRLAKRLPLTRVQEIRLDRHVDLIDRYELHFQGRPAVDVVKSVSLYRGDQLYNRLEQRELSALHRVFDKRRQAMRLYDLFGSDCLIQSRMREGVHFVDPLLIRWVVEMDTEGLEAAWLVVNGTIVSPSEGYLGNNRFSMHRVLAKQWVDSPGSAVELHAKRGFLRGLLVIMDELAERIEFRAHDIKIQTLGHENHGGVYYLEFPDLNLTLLDKLELRVWPIKPCEVTVVGVERHFNFQRHSDRETFYTTTLAPLTEK